MISLFPEEAVPLPPVLCQACEITVIWLAMKKHRELKGFADDHVLDGGINFDKLAVYVVDPAEGGDPEPTGYTFEELGFTGCEE